MLAILGAVTDPLRAQLDQATAERREVHARLDALTDRLLGTQIEATQARADAQAELFRREAAEAQAKDLRERLDEANARVDRLVFEVTSQRKAEAARAALEADGSGRRRWWPPWPRSTACRGKSCCPRLGPPTVSVAEPSPPENHTPLYAMGPRSKGLGGQSGR